MAEDSLDVFEPWTDSWKPVASPSAAPEAPMDAAAFLREEAIPEIAAAARRVQAVDHHLMMQDLLDLPDAALRVLFWPRPGLMAGSLDRTRVTLEFFVSREEPEEIGARWWSERAPEKPHSLGRILVELLDLKWIRSRVLDVIEAGLAEA